MVTHRCCVRFPVGADTRRHIPPLLEQMGSTLNEVFIFPYFLQTLGSALSKYEIKIEGTKNQNLFNFSSLHQYWEEMSKNIVFSLPQIDLFSHQKDFLKEKHI